MKKLIQIAFLFISLMYLSIFIYGLILFKYHTAPTVSSTAVNPAYQERIDTPVSLNILAKMITASIYTTSLTFFGLTILAAKRKYYKMAILFLMLTIVFGYLPSAFYGASTGEL